MQASRKIVTDDHPPKLLGLSLVFNSVEQSSWDVDRYSVKEFCGTYLSIYAYVSQVVSSL